MVPPHILACFPLEHVGEVGVKRFASGGESLSRAKLTPKKLPVGCGPLDSTSLTSLRAKQVRLRGVGGMVRRGKFAENKE